MCSIVEITLVIPTYNRENSLIKTLQKIFLGQCVPSEIIIVDQSDICDIAHGIKGFFEKQDWEGRWMIQKMNIPSSTEARNEGIRYASNDIIVFMDDDVEVEKETFSEVYQYMIREEYSMLGGIDKLAVPNGRAFPFLFGMRSWRRRKQGHVTMSMFGRYPTEINAEIPTQWAMGYFFAVKKSLIMKWNLKFDETMGQYAYSEDLDFSYSYYKHSVEEELNCILSPKVQVSHLCSKEWRVSDKRISYVMLFNRYYLSEKHFGNTTARILFWWSNVGLLLKKLIKRDNVKDFVMGMIKCIKYREDIKRGILHTELYV